MEGEIMNLVIVESPAKAKTIEKYLGKDYKVLASFGHVRDLPKNELGVDTEHNFAPKYVIPPKSRKTISSLKSGAADASTIYMATDYDREGEAIAWHIVEALKLKKIKRITFHEITKDAIKNAIIHPRDIDIHLVDAQQARRILDRLVGYKLSPFLWKKVFKGLSAGRVQSVAVRLIVDRERQIKDFKAEEYWTILANLDSNGIKISASLIGSNGKRYEKLEIKSVKDAEKLLEILKDSEYSVKKIESKNENRWPYPPFTTSTLQQEASKRLGYNAKRTMRLAQDLYEDGLITYMRTDSVNLASIAIDSARKLILSEFGQKYLPDSPKIYKTKSKGAQEAHEAIRPSYIDKKPETIDAPSEDHRKLYDLIWRRLIACQMNPMILETSSIDIDAKKNSDTYNFRANGTKIMFDGFSRVWVVKLEEKSLPKLSAGDKLNIIELIKNQHFTEPPARYTEASLIKTLEEYGIGRPSTYAPIISTIQDRGYVILDKKVFFPQETAFIVTDLLVNNFPEIVDLKFTANMEEKFDEIAENKEDWVKMLKAFYVPFEANLREKEKTVSKADTEEKTDKICPKCKKPLIIKRGKFGKFIACTGFPECKYTEQIVISTGLKCPECKEGDVIERKTRRHKTFWGCSKYPKCKWASWNDPRKQK
jgi:DNA topoisomerase-1